MKLEVNIWTNHLNQLMYSYFYFCHKNKIEPIILCNKKIAKHGAVLFYKDKSIFFDYSDDPIFMEQPHNFDFYFKRSLLFKDANKNVFPLNFNLALSYKSPLLLSKLKFNLLFDKDSRIEVIRSLDFFALFTNSSHSIFDIKKFPSSVLDSGGKVIFHTRLWDPDRHPDPEEKERRRLQNDFRINACRIIKKHFNTASVGLFADELSTIIAPDLLLETKHSKKSNYLNALKNYDIGIADDGLKDTPGWKIGEYLLFGKALITTPLNVSIDHFCDDKNFLKVSDRNSFQEIPDLIYTLLYKKKYLQMAQNNFDWANEYLHPKNYIQRILTLIEEK